MKYTKELQNISNFCNTGEALDMVIEIFKRYYNEPDVEDISMVIFFDRYYGDRSKFKALIDNLISFQSLHSHDKGELDRVYQMAEVYAKKYSQGGDLFRIMGSSHFVLGALDVIPGLQEVMKSSGAGKEELEAASEAGQEGYSKMVEASMDFINKIIPALSKETENDDEESFMESIGFPLPDGELSKKKSSGKTPMLDKYAREMTKEVTDPVFGRESELSQLLEVLECKKKNNAILIGEPGVGKTSVVELLSQRIRERRVPRQFLGKRIFSLDLNSLVAGTKYRGQYEERLQGIIEEVISNSDIIIFIDEIHNLIGNGGSDGNGDAANILKPYLAKGLFQCIGSTTFREYRKYIEKDGALKRRFQNIRIEEPTLEETGVILGKIKKYYETHHNVVYPKETIEACIKMSQRYLPDRFFPDKAIDLLDLSGSLARLSQSSKETESYQKSLEEVEEWKEKKIRAVMETNFQEALGYREKEMDAFRKLSNPGDVIKVSLSDVYQAVGKRSGVPLESIGSSDLDKLRHLNSYLPTQVIGQDKAIKEIIMSLQRNSLGIRDQQKPIASLLFVGPTGSGKTYLCKTLAKEFFGSEDSLIKFDMSEYGERHEITKLTGASASYVGYDDEPGFEMIRKHPYSVVLFDEIEKAAPEIYQIFLSILDEGYVTLGNGTKVNFKNTIIIFTGNIGTKDLNLYGRGLGYGGGNTIDPSRKDSIIQKAIEKTFAPEFINRLSRVVIFDNLGKKELTKIIDLEISKLSERLKESKIILKISKSLKEYIISECDIKYGARDLQRGISKHIEETLCEKLLSESLPDGPKTFLLDYKDRGVTIELKTKKKSGNKLLCPQETECQGETKTS